MNNIIKTFSWSWFLVQVVYGIYPNSQNVANLFFRHNLAVQDTTISMGCFSDYIVKSNEISEAYGQSYNQCLMDAKAGRQATETEMIDKRVTIEKTSGNICNQLSTCNAQNTTLEIFHCHANIGANNTKAVYSISGNASEYANVLQEKYRILDLRHEQCCKASERRYVESTTVNYRYLQDCLDGHIKPSQSLSAPLITTTTQPASRILTSAAEINYSTDITTSEASNL